MEATEAPKRRLLTRDQQLRLFFSVDLVNGTDFKNRRPPESDFGNGDGVGRSSWTHRFGRFFSDFNREFAAAVEAERRAVGAEDVLALPRLWKINGDELLFNELVYPHVRHRHLALVTSIRAFVKLVGRFDAELLTDAMGVRGCVWTAGFPIRNRAVRVVQETGIPIIRTSKDFDTGDYLPPPASLMDYIGRDMDLGFRLAAVTPPGRIACSLDVADLLSHAPDPPNVFLLGWRRLKGIADGLPYPFLWLDNSTAPAPRHPWDQRDEQTPEEVRRLLSAPAEVRMTGEGLRELADELRRQMPAHLIKPYVSNAEIHPQHGRFWDHEVLGVLDLPSGVTASEDRLVASPSSVPTITMDDLNQLQIVLQSQPDQARLLAEVLRAIADHDAYRRWKAGEQFEGLLFRMPAGLVFPDDERRRLLETLRLVVDDALRVKVNVTDAGVFVTDGLWVPGEFRVFPFHDETDLLRRACTDLGWDDWATCVVDPATGCGHNVLGYPSRAARRYGFDINARGISYAAINRALNGVGTACLGINDVRGGIPPVFGQDAAERVLVLVNMPFALVPEAGTLPRSADGGRYGYELTQAALTGVRDLAASLAEGSELRCLVLTYSVGSQREQRWVAHQHALELFGPERVTWRLLAEERLWRVNGRKEQTNPMPLDKLALKADCRFYVRRDAIRQSVREDYLKLERELRERGWDHLAYGVIAIDAGDGAS